MDVWNHTHELKPLDDQPIIRQNRDTLYGGSIVNVRGGVTITLSDASERHISVWVMNQDRNGPVILRDPGEHVLTPELFGTD